MTKLNFRQRQMTVATRVNAIQLASVDNWFRTQDVESSTQSDLLDTCLDLIFQQVPEDLRLKDIDTARIHLANHGLLLRRQIKPLTSKVKLSPLTFSLSEEEDSSEVITE